MHCISHTSLGKLKNKNYKTLHIACWQKLLNFVILSVSEESPVFLFKKIKRGDPSD
jgi:hypothetical protein